MELREHVPHVRPFAPLQIYLDLRHVKREQADVAVSDLSSAGIAASSVLSNVRRLAYCFWISFCASGSPSDSLPSVLAARPREILLMFFGGGRVHAGIANSDGARAFPDRLVPGERASDLVVTGSGPGLHVPAQQQLLLHACVCVVCAGE